MTSDWPSMAFYRPSTAFKRPSMIFHDLPLTFHGHPRPSTLNFQVSASFDAAHLSSSTDASTGGTAAYAEGAWAGAEATLNDPPSAFQLVGSDAASTHEGLISLGAVTLNVVGSAVTLISGVIVELISADAAGTQHRLSAVDIVAGLGYADVSLAARRTRRQLAPHATLEPSLRLRAAMRRALASRAGATAVGRRRRAQSSGGCDACTARVYGDVSEDCTFTSADILAVQQLAAAMQAYVDGTLATSPLAAFACEWPALQANPTLDFLAPAAGGWAPTPRIDLLDAQHVQLAVARKYVLPLTSRLMTGDGG